MTSDTAWNLGIVIGSLLLMTAQVAAACGSGYFQPQPIKKRMAADSVETLTHTFVASRLDYRIQAGLAQFNSTISLFVCEILLYTILFAK